eukprot:TRINITY_DN28600_c0_g1_i1.p1 TRINITY_DN28600_c0_g1~~TRINITY_DN28600_c0_g1_i1.p1  ORF type:complete len:813 (-),score=148.91 TRINITY_DN28600_c0_g1_i1:43-2481(-)
MARATSRLGKKHAKAKGHQGRGGNRAAEEEEIKTLEERIRLESPRPGTGIGSTGGAEVGKQSGGPALTARPFKALPLSGRTLRGLQTSKYFKMTEIQGAAIPHALSGRDILGEARTGSGKTLAFLVPLMECLFRNRWTQMDGLGGLVVSPTRELAYQIYQVLTNIGSDHEVSAGCIVGGRSLEEEQKAVASMSVLVATPGRLLQHLDESPGFDASSLLMLVIDEADRILDFGFQETMHNILTHLPQDRQTLLFSATLHNSVHRLGRAALRSPEVVSVHRDAKNRTPEKLKQIFMTVPLDKKVDTLFSFLRSHSQKKIIVFVSTCKQVRFLFESFRKLKPGPAVMELHGRQSLTKRMVVFQEFTERERAVALLCTDIAARGVDFPAVDWVVQVDCPDSVDSYIHRVGRTARYQSLGRSAIFLLPSEKAFVDKLTKARVNVRNIVAKQTKISSIQQQLASLLAGAGDIRHLAQRAFASYLRSVKLMKDKDVFDSKELPKQEFAMSLGLADVPELGAIWDEDTQEDADNNTLKKRKNQSALQRLKDKIKAKKQESKESSSMQAKDEEDEEDRELNGDGAKKKLSRWERRQRRIAAASGRKAADGASDAAPAAVAEEEDDFLQPVAAGAEEAAAAAAAASAATRKKRLKIGRDGSAVGAEGSHTFFTGRNGVKETSELAQLAEELSGSAKPPVDEGGRAKFLKRVASDLAERDSSDAAVSRARIHEVHQKKRRKAKQAKDRDDDDSADDFRAPSPAVSPPPSPSPSPRRLPAASSGRSNGPAAANNAKAPSKLAADDSLGDLEKQALSRLSGGLFA